MKRFAVILVVGLVGATDEVTQVDAASLPPVSLIQLIAPLDEPEYYCIDIRGFGFEVLLDSLLQTHTCKHTQFEDGLFSFGQPSDGQLYMEEYRVCMEAGAAEEGAPLYVGRCSDAEL